MKTLSTSQLKENQKIKAPSKDHRQCEHCQGWFHKKGIRGHQAKCYSVQKPNKRTEKKALKLTKKRKGFHNAPILLQGNKTSLANYRTETARVGDNLKINHGNENNFYQSTLLWAKPSLQQRHHNFLESSDFGGIQGDPFEDEWEDIPSSENCQDDDKTQTTVNVSDDDDDITTGNESETEDDFNWNDVDENDGFGEDEGDPDKVSTTNEEFLRVLSDHVNAASVDNSAKKAFSFGDNIPVHIIAQIDLLCILLDRRVDMKLFDDIMSWLHHHSQTNQVKWKSVKLRKRKPLLKWIGKAFETEKLDPIPKQVELSHSLVTIPCFDVVEQIMSLIYDSEVFKESNLLKGNFDPKTWRPTGEISEDDVLGDIHTGSLYREALEKFCPPGHTINGLRALGLPLIFFINKTHSDFFGALSTTPLSFTLGILSKEFRRKYKAWRHAAFLPNTAFGMGKHHITDEEFEKIIPKEKLEDLHRMIAAVLAPLQHLIDEDGGIKCVLEGEVVMLVPWIHLVVGDAVGNNELCGHYNGNNAKCLVKDCKCTKEELIQIPPVCEFITMDDL